MGRYLALCQYRLKFINNCLDQVLIFDWIIDKFNLAPHILKTVATLNSQQPLGWREGRDLEVDCNIYLQMPYYVEISPRLESAKNYPPLLMCLSWKAFCCYCTLKLKKSVVNEQICVSPASFYRLENEPDAHQVFLNRELNCKYKVLEHGQECIPILGLSSPTLVRGL